MDESMITGESHAAQHDRVVAGTVATDNAIRGGQPLRSV